MKKFLLSFLISLLIFSFIFVGVDKVLFSSERLSVAADLKDEDYKNTDKKSEELEEEEIDSESKNEILVLLMGVDTKDIKESKGSRTDTMMLVKANFDNGDIDILSIPRDTRVLVKGQQDKINHAHAYGGADLSIQSVRDFLNLDLDYYVKVDYKAVMEIVDAIGGVEVDVPRDMIYQDISADPPLDINIKKGRQVLDGKNAHDFLRWRKNNEQTSGYGDVGRIESQQMFLKELVNQTLKPKNIFKLPRLIETYYDYVETNIPLSVILKGAVSANKIDSDKVETVIVPGEDQNIAKLDYWVYNEDETKRIVEEMFGDYLLD